MKPLSPTLVTAPAAPPISLAEIKAHARIETDDDDALLAGLIDAAVAHLDGRAGILGRCLVTQTWRLDLADFYSSLIALPFPDCAVTSVKYSDTDGVEQTVSADLYAVHDDARGSFIRFSDDFDAPSVNTDRLDAVRIAFDAGYGAADAVPQTIKQALLMIVAHWYEHRETAVVGTGATDIPLGANALLSPFRRVGI